MTWFWKPSDPDGALTDGLLYEPGHWGDLLKAVWAVEVAAALLEGDGRPLVFADPFAGAASYPLPEASREKLPGISGTLAGRLLEPFVGSDRLPSTSALVLELGRQQGRPVEAHLFELNPARRGSWQGVPETRLLPLADGWEFLASPARLGEVELVLVDPYDLHLPHRFKPALAGLRSLWEGGAHLLLYLYNRACRSVPLFREYQQLRRQVTEAVAPIALTGRVPADGRLPRAWHELLLLPAPTGRPGLSEALLNTLRQQTEQLAWYILRPGCVE